MIFYGIYFGICYAEVFRYDHNHIPRLGGRVANGSELSMIRIIFSSIKVMLKEKLYIPLKKYIPFPRPAKKENFFCFKGEMTC